MKKFLLSTLVLFGLFSMNASAQFDFPTNSGKKKAAITPGIGVKVGGTATKLSGDLDNKNEFADGYGYNFEVGALAHLRFGSTKARNGKSPFALQAEILYKAGTAKTVGDEDLKLSHLEIPVVLQVYPFNGKKHLDGLYVEAGPSFAAAISSSPDVINIAGQGEYHTGDLKANDIRVAVGLGYRTYGGFGVGVRYYLGTSELAKNLPLKTNTLEIGLSYTFMFGKKK